MENSNPTLSIITPTYNRGDILRGCFESLRVQSNVDFEWIVVDDGSEDDTQSVIEQIRNEKVPFPISYIWKENGGKHTALNASHSFIKGKYVLILDSDDKLTPDAVETVLKEWTKYEQQTDIGILIFLRENFEHTICAYAKDEYQPVDLLNYKRVRVISSDCCEVLKTEWFRKYPFPVFEGERFLAETALWYRVGLETRCVYINKAIYVCEYLDGGLTKSGRSMFIRNPQGCMYNSYLRMNRRCRLQERIKAGLLYICYGFFAGEKAGKLVRNANPYGILAFICLLPGKLMYLLWKRKY